MVEAEVLLEFEVPKLSADGAESRAEVSSCYRLLVLVSICLLTLGSYFSFDNPGALGEEFKENLAQNSTGKQLFFYSSYSWPNVIQPFVGGFIIDAYLGIRGGSIICSLLVTLGVTLVAIAGTLQAPDGSIGGNPNLPFYIALTGRFVFGLGGECLTVCQNVFCSKWFRDKHIALAFAIVLSFSRVGSAVNFAVEKPIADAYGFPIALWLSVLLCIMSFGACVVLGMLDRNGERIGAVKPTATGEDFSFQMLFYVLRLEPILVYLICVFFYSAVFTFVAIALQFFAIKYGSNASYLASLPYTVSACLSPLLGLSLDKVGYMLVWVMVASCSLCCIHILFAWTTVPPIVAMVWLGFTYSICAAALWPMVSLIVDTHLLGTAYGAMTALQNLGLAVAPLVVGEMLPDSPGSDPLAIEKYERVEMLFAGFAALAFLCCLILTVVNRSRGGMLTSSANEVAKRNREAARLARGDSGASTGSSMAHSLENIASPTVSKTASVTSPFLLKTPEMIRRDYLRKLDIMSRTAPIGR